MFLFLFLGISWLLCFVWCLVLIQKLFGLNSIDAVSEVGDAPTKDGTRHTVTKAQLDELMPVGTAKAWKLERVLNGHRVWQISIYGSTKLYAVSLKVKSSSQNLTKFLGRPSMFKEWRCSISLSSAPKEPTTNSKQVLKWRQKKLDCGLIAETSSIYWWLEPFLEAECTVSRVFLSGAKYTGIMETNEYSGESTIFICQPIIGLENDQCRLTVITSGDINRLTSECQCLSDHFAMMRATVDTCQPLPDTCNIQSDENEESLAETDPAASSVANEQPASNEDVTSAGSGDYCSAHTTSDESTSPVGELSGPSNGADGDGTAGGDNVKRERKLSTADIESVSDKFQLSRSGSQHLDLTSSIESSLESSARREQVEGYNSVVFLRTISSDNQRGLVDYKTLSNNCAADLLAEVLTATTSARRLSQDRSDGIVTGWVFDSTDREVVVLHKHPTAPGTPGSWMGKGLIKEKPAVVWQTVVNPYSRYIFDEMLKDLTVLSDLGNGMKLLRLLYSTSQVLRKDNREFYLIQAERIERRKRIVTICSFEWPDPELKECPRGKFMTSGWIMEPVVSKRNNNYSMLTYLTQVDLGDLSTSGVQQFEEEFVNRQPLAIAHLRDYLIAK